MVLKNRGELMYTVYIIFTFVIVLSFITGNIVLYKEHKFSERKLVLQKDILVDEEVL